MCLAGAGCWAPVGWLVCNRTLAVAAAAPGGSWQLEGREQHLHHGLQLSIHGDVGRHGGADDGWLGLRANEGDVGSSSSSSRGSSKNGFVSGIHW